MSIYAETRTEAWNRRNAIAGQVDFTMMYVAHDAFSRDIAQLTTAATAGRGLTPAAVATWRRFRRRRTRSRCWKSGSDRRAGTPSPKRPAASRAAEYLPWVLDGATEKVAAKALQMLPPPARLLYRRMWGSRYRKAQRLG